MTERNARYGRHSHGSTKAEKGAIKAFAAQAKENPPEIPLEPVYILPACTCSFKPYPHTLHGYENERHGAGAGSWPVKAPAIRGEL